MGGALCVPKTDDLIVEPVEDNSDTNSVENSISKAILSSSQVRASSIHMLSKHVKHAAFMFSKYPSLRSTFLNYLCKGVWLSEFLETNPNLFSALCSANNETQYQASISPLYNQRNNNTVTISGNMVAGHDHGSNNNILNLNVGWIEMFDDNPRPLLAVIVVCSLPIFLQSREFELWHEYFLNESPPQSTQGSDDLMRDTVLFRLVDFTSFDVDEAEDEKCKELAQLKASSVNVLHPSLQNITVGHRSKISRETSSNRVLHRANRVEALIRRMLLLHSNTNIMTSADSSLPKQQQVQERKSDLKHTLDSLFPSTLNPGADNMDGQAASRSMQYQLSPTPSQPRATTIAEQVLESPWLKNIQQFLHELPFPVFVARVCNLERRHIPQYSEFFWTMFGNGRPNGGAYFSSEKQHYTIVATNAAFLSLTGSKRLSDVLGTTVYDTVFDGAQILSQHSSVPPSSTLPALYPVHFLMQSIRKNKSKELYPTFLTLKPVHHVIAHPAYHYLIGIPYDLTPQNPTPRSSRDVSQQTFEIPIRQTSIFSAPPSQRFSLLDQRPPSANNSKRVNNLGVAIQEKSNSSETMESEGSLRNNSEPFAQEGSTQGNTNLQSDRLPVKSYPPTYTLGDKSAIEAGDNKSSVRMTKFFPSSSLPMSPTQPQLANRHPIIAPVIEKVVSLASENVHASSHLPDATETIPTKTLALSFAGLEMDLPMIEDALNLLPHILL